MIAAIGPNGNATRAAYPTRAVRLVNAANSIARAVSRRRRFTEAGYSTKDDHASQP